MLQNFRHMKIFYNGNSDNNSSITLSTDRQLTWAEADPKAHITMHLLCRVGEYCGNPVARGHMHILIPSPKHILHPTSLPWGTQLMGSCPRNQEASFPGQPAKGDRVLKIISPQCWACGISLLNANSSSCATPRLLAQCLPDPQPC